MELMPKKMQCPSRSEIVPLDGDSTHIQRPRIKRQSKFECFCFECGRYNEERKMMVLTLQIGSEYVSYVLDKNLLFTINHGLTCLRMKA